MEISKFHTIKHLPFSQSISSDDSWLENCDCFEGKVIILTEKMDGENCLEEGTIIATDKGDIFIEDISINDGYKIITFNIHTETLEPQDVLAILHSDPQQQEWVEVELEDGSLLLCTIDHPIWLPNQQCYRLAKYLKKGDFLLALKK